MRLSELDGITEDTLTGGEGDSSQTKTSAVDVNKVQ